MAERPLVQSWSRALHHLLALPQANTLSCPVVLTFLPDCDAVMQILINSLQLSSNVHQLKIGLAISEQINIIFQFLRLEINEVLFSLSLCFCSDKSLYNYIFRELYNHFL